MKNLALRSEIFEEIRVWRSWSSATGVIRIQIDLSSDRGLLAVPFMSMIPSYKAPLSLGIHVGLPEICLCLSYRRREPTCLLSFWGPHLSLAPADCAEEEHWSSCRLPPASVKTAISSFVQHWDTPKSMASSRFASTNIAISGYTPFLDTCASSKLLAAQPPKSTWIFVILFCSSVKSYRTLGCLYFGR